MPGILHEDLSTFRCCRRHTFALKHFYATLGIFVWLTVTCSSTVHTERIVAFPSQQWLRERAAFLRYTYIAYVFALRRIVLLIKILG
jgi:hypothetical protein